MPARYAAAVRRVTCECPVCGGRISLNYGDYQKYVRKNTRPTCSRECGAKYRQQKKAEMVKE